ncbi:MAG TPA: C4-type zinc ribbon domain-containing protein [Vicinamibacterales bacterium]|nr:C4-type zinc ribbon domain-containing protein [Vicinamibacterales bacterium]
MLPDLERLIHLQDVESRAAVANKAIAEAPGRIAALDALLQSATASLAAAKQSLADNQNQRRSIDKDLTAAQQRVDKYKEQIMAVKTNEQLHAMQHQMKAVADEVLQHEERILVNMMSADEINASIKKAEAALKAAQSKVATERAAIESEAKTHQATLIECAASRGKIVAAMDNKGAVETFERIAKVRGTAVARAEGERCTICQVRLRPAVFAEVRRNESLQQCDSCNRILYFVAPQAPKAPEAPQASASARNDT